MGCPHTNIDLCELLSCELWEEYSAECMYAYHGEYNLMFNRPSNHKYCNGTWQKAGKDIVCPCECHHSDTQEIPLCFCEELLKGHDKGCLYMKRKHKSKVI